MDDFKNSGKVFIVKKLSVSDPRQVGEGMKSHTVYNVSSICELNDTEVEFNVTRRYKDFLWLHNTLGSSFKGYMIPPMPDKKFLGNTATDHVEKRQAYLDKFLGRVSDHYKLKTSEDFFNFISMGEKEFTKLRHGVAEEDTTTKSKASAFFSMTGSYLKDQFKNISEALVHTGGYEKTEHDVNLEKLAEYNDHLSSLLSASHKQSSELRSSWKQLSESWFEMGLAVSKLGELEQKHEMQELADLLCAFGQGSDRVSVLATEKLDSVDLEFEETLKDLMKLSLSAKKMLEDREIAFKKYLQALAMLESSRSKAIALKEKNKVEKFRAQEEVVNGNIILVDERKSYLDNLTDSAFAEFAEFKQFKLKTLKELSVLYIKGQIEHSKKVIGVWEEVLESMTLNE